jgi:hypothetical protein
MVKTRPNNFPSRVNIICPAMRFIAFINFVVSCLTKGNFSDTFSAGWPAFLDHSVPPPTKNPFRYADHICDEFIF